MAQRKGPFSQHQTPNNKLTVPNTMSHMGGGLKCLVCLFASLHIPMIQLPVHKLSYCAAPRAAKFIPPPGLLIPLIAVQSHC
jgi:hypothetical protein